MINNSQENLDNNNLERVKEYVNFFEEIVSKVVDKIAEIKKGEGVDAEYKGILQKFFYDYVVKMMVQEIKKQQTNKNKKKMDEEVNKDISENLPKIYSIIQSELNNSEKKSASKMIRQEKKVKKKKQPDEKMISQILKNLPRIYSNIKNELENFEKKSVGYILSQIDKFISNNEIPSLMFDLSDLKEKVNKYILKEMNPFLDEVIKTEISKKFSDVNTSSQLFRKIGNEVTNIIEATMDNFICDFYLSKSFVNLSIDPKNGKHIPIDLLGHIVRNCNDLAEQLPWTIYLIADHIFGDPICFQCSQDILSKMIDHNFGLTRINEFKKFSKEFSNQVQKQLKSENTQKIIAQNELSVIDDAKELEKIDEAIALYKRRFELPSPEVDKKSTKPDAIISMTKKTYNVKFVDAVYIRGRAVSQKDSVPNIKNFYSRRT